MDDLAYYYAAPIAAAQFQENAWAVRGPARPDSRQPIS
jgi:hypothetical protein